MSNTVQPPGQNSFLARYGATILRGGIATVPAALFRFQAELGLKPQQVWFVAAILSHKWDANMPHPSLKRMSNQTGVSRRQLHNYQRQLVELGLLDVLNRQTETGGKDTNFYDFSALFEQLEAFLARESERRSSSSHTHVNHSSHTYAKPGSSGHANASSHQKKKNLKDSVKVDSEDFESSNVRKVKSDKKGISEPRSDVPASGNGAEAKAKMESIGRVLELRNKRPEGGSDRPEVMDEDYQKIQHYIGDRAREFTDTAPLKSSTTRAWNLFQKSGLSVDDFVSHIYQARSLTLEGTGRITKTVDDPNHRVKRKTKMAYFFAVLEDQLGFGKSGGSAGGGGKSTPPSPQDGDPYGIQR
jgi:hypothetical protein